MPTFLLAEFFGGVAEHCSGHLVGVGFEKSSERAEIFLADFTQHAP